MQDKTYTLTQHFTEIGAEKLESLVMEKVGEKVSDLVFFIHGFNYFGAWESLFFGNGITEEGWTPVFISQPGFGYSSVSRDYCGPKTYDSIAKAIEEVSAKYNIPSKKRIVWGVSRGAIVTSLLSSKYPNLAAGFICQSGCYDFKKDFERPDKNPEIKKNVIEETNGASEEALKERSVVNFVSNIAKPVLILHGKDDVTFNVDQAYLFIQALEKEGKQYESKIVDGEHQIGVLVRKQFVFPFIKKIFTDSK